MTDAPRTGWLARLRAGLSRTSTALKDSIGGIFTRKKLDAATIGAAAQAAQDEVHPISDVRASAWYRKEMIHNMTKRILEDVAANH